MATPPRSQFYDIAGYSNAGNFTLVTTTRVTVYVAVPYAGTPQTTLASLFSAETGAGTPGNPFNATTGEINFWAAPGSYDIKIEDTGSPAKFATRIIRWDAMPADEGVAGTMITDNAIDLTKIAASLSQLLMPPGLVLPYGGAAAPTGFLLCDGAAVLRSTYAALFTAIGTTFGPGDGSTTFNVPDLRGRVPMGVDGTAGRISSTPDTLGTNGGEERHTMTLTELVSHVHPLSTVFNPAGTNIDNKQASEATPGNSTTMNTAAPTGANATPFNVVQPYQVTQYVVKT